MPAATRRRRTWLLGGLPAPSRARRPAGLVVEQRTLPGGHRRCRTRRLGGGQRAGLRLRRRGAGGPTKAGDPLLLLRLDPRDSASAAPPRPAKRCGAGGAGSPAREAGDPRSATAGAGADDRRAAKRREPKPAARDRLATLPAIGRRACHQSPAPENADAAHQRARAARRASAEEGRQRAARDVLKSRRREAEAALAQRQAGCRAAAARELARHALDDTEIAPFAGRVGQRQCAAATSRRAAAAGGGALEQAYVVRPTERIRPGQPVEPGGGHVRAARPRRQRGAGLRRGIALLPPDNATGNFTKIVQRFPVRIRLDADAAERPGCFRDVGDRHRGHSRTGRSLRR